MLKEDIAIQGLDYLEAYIEDITGITRERPRAKKPYKLAIYDREKSAWIVDDGTCCENLHWFYETLPILYRQGTTHLQEYSSGRIVSFKLYIKEREQVLYPDDTIKHAEGIKILKELVDKVMKDPDIPEY